MADRRVARKPLILIAIVTVLAGVLFYLFGGYGVVGVGVLGLCATFGLKFENAEFTYPHMAQLSWWKAEGIDGEGGQSWLVTAVEGGYSFALVVLGVMLLEISLEQTPPQFPDPGESAEHRENCDKGSAAFEARNYDLAIDQLTLCIDHGNLTIGSLLIAHYVRGNARMEIGEYEPAINDFTAALLLDPGFLPAKQRISRACKKAYALYKSSTTRLPILYCIQNEGWNR